MNLRRGAFRALVVVGTVWLVFLAWHYDILGSIGAITSKAPTSSEQAASLDAAFAWQRGCTGERAVQCLEATPAVIPRPLIFRDEAWANLGFFIALGPVLLGFLGWGGSWVWKGIIEHQDAA